MKSTGIAELKARLTAYIDRVRGGQEVVVTDRGMPVAKIVPLEGVEKREGMRARLIREGVLLPGRGRVRRSLLSPPPGAAAGGKVLATLIEERRQGR